MVLITFFYFLDIFAHQRDTNKPMKFRKYMIILLSNHWQTILAEVTLPQVHWRPYSLFNQFQLVKLDFLTYKYHCFNDRYKFYRAYIDL